MKLGKTSWSVLAVGIVVIMAGTLGMARSQQVSEQNQQKEELAVAQLRLDRFQVRQLYAQEDELKERLNIATSQLEAAKDDLRQSTDSIELTPSLFELAEACSVEITAISSSRVASDELESITWSVVRLTFTAEGSLPNLIAFIISLNNDFTTGVVESTDIAIPGATGEGTPSANIRLVIYGYRGD